MKIAIPTFATRVSPRFDCARSILVVTIDEGEASERQELTASDWAPHERINRLLELGTPGGPWKSQGNQGPQGCGDRYGIGEWKNVCSGRSGGG